MVKRAFSILFVGGGAATEWIDHIVLVVTGNSSLRTLEICKVTPFAPPGRRHEEPFLTWFSSRRFQEGMGVSTCLQEDVFDYLPLFFSSQFFAEISTTLIVNRFIEIFNLSSHFCLRPVTLYLYCSILDRTKTCLQHVM